MGSLITYSSSTVRDQLCAEDQLCASLFLAPWWLSIWIRAADWLTFSFWLVIGCLVWYLNWHITGLRTNCSLIILSKQFREFSGYNYSAQKSQSQVWIFWGLAYGICLSRKNSRILYMTLKIPIYPQKCQYAILALVFREFVDYRID